MECGKMCKFDTCVYDWYVKGVECDKCEYYMPYKLVDGSKMILEEDSHIDEIDMMGFISDMESFE